MPPTNLSLARHVDTACDRFESAWRAGRKPRIEDFLKNATAGDRAGLLKALIAVEIELRRGAGEEVKPGAYRKRFAEDADAVASAFAEPGRPRAAGETSVSRDSVKTGDFEGRTDTAKPVLADVPKQIGRFPVTGVLGSGAFGRVYRAKDPQLGRDVAIKVPLPSAIASPADRERFLREARASAGLHHPNICPVHEIGEENGHPFIVMGYVPGQSLAATLKARKEPLAAKQAALIARKLALALDAAHKKGVVHRDLKPANVMFDKERRDVVVTDFGLARAPRLDDSQTTRDGVLMGTPAYMSPEQARGDTKAVGPASDQYALGVMLFEMLTGRRPFTGTVTEVLGKILHVEPESPAILRPDLDHGLAAVCLKAMSKDPAARYGSMRELADALLSFASDVPTRPTGVPGTASETAKGATETQRIADVFAFTEQAVEKAIRKHRTPIWVKVGIGVLILIGLVVPAIMFFSRTPTAELQITLKDIDLADKSLSFFLDEQPISAEKLAGKVELSPGDHVLVVKRGSETVKRLLLRVTGGRKASMTVEDITPPPPPPDDSKLWQGKWRCVAEHSGRREWTAEELKADNKAIAITGNRLTINRGSDGQRRTFDGQFSLNPAVTPKQFDWQGTAPDKSPFVMSGVYELKDGRLRLCYRNDPNGKAVARAGWADLDQNRVVTVTLEREDEAEPGFVPLFNGKDLTGWKAVGEPKWTWSGGRALGSPAPMAAGFLMTDTDYEDFELKLQFRLSAGSGSGLFLRTDPNMASGAAQQLGVQLVDDDHFPTLVEINKTGSVYNTFPRKVAPPVKKGDWNALRVRLEKRKIQVWINDVQTIDADLDDARAQFAQRPGLTRKTGRIGLQQNQKADVEFRDAWIKELAPKVDHDRVAAEYILSVGGKVSINFQPRLYTNTWSLPAEPFQLTAISLNGNKQATNAGLAVVKDCRQLRFLDFGGTQITDVGLAHFKDHINITSLHMPYMRVTDEGLANFKNCKELNSLIVHDTKVTDAGLAYFQDCKNLETLWVSGLPITDEGIAPFANCKYMKWFDLRATKVTSEGYRKLRAALPNCTIGVNPGIP
jgi:uncharacterized protein (TIGR03067 family)